MALRAPMHKNRTTTMGRISGFLSSTNIFRTINLPNQLYDETRELSGISHFPVLGPPEEWKKWRFEKVIQQNFLPVNIGDSFGPSWTTHWFKVVIDVPLEWKGKEVHLRWATGSEACLYNDSGKVLQGISPSYREEYIISKEWNPETGPLTFYLEMSCNTMFGAADGADIEPPNPDRYFILKRAEIGLFNRLKFKIMIDLEQLEGIASSLKDEHIGYQAMFTANEIINEMRLNELSKASTLGTKFFEDKNGGKAHVLYAMGHCHIDTAWLWPYSETIRKCARSFSAQLRLMKEYPDFKFSCSSAQQYEWVKEYYPGLFEEIKTYVSRGQFLPVGGCWVEMDGNIPNGESFIRQYFYGQNFFRKEFGITCQEFWLPDTFGYSAQIPQMLKHVGIKRFLTQKISWNLVNKFPHHNFWWEGIDGTKVIVHFPPGESYNMSGTVKELLYSQNNSRDKGRSNKGAYLFGYGDGGGGPTRTIIERLQRVKDVTGIPKVIFENTETFFSELEKESDKFSKWVGELYLELHNGTYTSQALIKWYNRKTEFIFYEVEQLMVGAYTSGKIEEATVFEYKLLLDKCWKKFLCNQFHDVLPGTSIELVQKDVWKIYREVFADLMALRLELHQRLINTGGSGQYRAIYNPLPWQIKSVVFLNPASIEPPTGPNTQVVTLDHDDFEDQIEGRYRVPNRFTAALLDLSASGYTSFSPQVPNNPVTYVENIEPGKSKFENGFIQLQYTNSPAGRIPEENIFYKNNEPVYNDFKDLGIKAGAFYIYDDIPLFWDAWDCMDYHLETRREPEYESISGPHILSEGPLVGCYKWSAKFGNNSSICRYTIMRAESGMVEHYVIVDWKESHKFLKVEFPMDVLANEATYEIQCGYLKRPTHQNTSWEMAKFEVCGHKWMDISQADKGVTVITDSKYGWHVRDNIVKLSLLRSPKNPDANCDMHKHFIYYAVLPHNGCFKQERVIQKAHELNYLGANNLPYLASDLPGSELPVRWVTTNNDAVIVEAFKVAAQIPRAVCLRLYESLGGYADTSIELGFQVSEVRACNGLEDLGEIIAHSGNCFKVRFGPFQIRSFMISF